MKTKLRTATTAATLALLLGAGGAQAALVSAAYTGTWDGMHSWNPGQNGGKVVEAGIAKEVFSNPQHAYTRRLISALPHGNAAEAPNKRSTTIADKTLLKVEHLTKHYVLASGAFSSKRTFKAVDDISFEVRRGETLGIVGESGSGKSSVARMLLGLN